MPKKVSKSEVNEAIDALNKVRKNWLKAPGVTAVDVGYKLKENEITDELALRVHVKRKLPLEALESYERFSISGDPEKIGKFRVDVIEAEYGPAMMGPFVLQEAAEVSPRSRVDPLVGGVSVANARVTAGTLGAIVWDRTDGRPCILSNWHVLCGSAACQAGEPIYQPGRLDGGSALDTVATLKRWLLGGEADAALAELNGARAHTRDLLGLDPITGIEQSPTIGTSVIKSGRTTGITEGIIDGLSMSVSINYGDAGVQSFHDQIRIVPHPPWPATDYELSKGGDSGSVWLNKDNGKAVGLHFAGETDSSPSAELAIANPMVKLAELLNFSITPIFRPPPPIDENRLREILRRILARRFPWGTGPAVQSMTMVPGQPPAPPAYPGLPPSAPGIQALEGPALTPLNIEGLLDEIMAELHRGG